MKLLSLVLSLSLAGCYALSNPQGAAQHVGLIDAKNQTYKTTCNGAVEDWGTCFGRASKSCPSGYNTIERFETPLGGRRELTFQCKK